MNKLLVCSSRIGKIVIGIMVLLNFGFLPFLFADNTPRLLPSSYIVKSDKNELSVSDAIKFSLLFSGVQGDALSEKEAELQSLVNDFGKEVEKKTSEKELAEKTLQYLHKKIMKRYSENQTLIDVVLETGRYNCVSSAVLYMILAESAGLKVIGVKTTDHVFCRVLADGTEYDVETTNQYGFDPGSKKDFTDSFGNVTGYSYVSPANYKKRKDLSEAQLITVILHNRISYLEKANKFNDAVGLAVDAYSFTADADSNEIFIDAIVNMGAWYNSKMLFDEGILFFDGVISQFGHTDKFDEVMRGLSYNKLVKLLDSKKFDEADTFASERHSLGNISDGDFTDFSVDIALVRGEELSKISYGKAIASIEESLGKYGAVKRLSEMRDSLVNNWVASLINSKKPDDAIKVIEGLYTKKELGERDYLRYSSLAYQEKAQLIADDQGDLSASEYCKGIMAKIGNESGISKMNDYFISSFEIKTHNKAATLINSGKYDEAKKVLEKALQSLPGSTKIRNDLDKVMKAMEKP